MGNKKTGTCKWFDARRGYGFIASDDGEDYYVHFTEIDMDGFRTMRKGDVVEFTASDTDRGPAATAVTVLTPAPAGA